MIAEIYLIDLFSPHICRKDLVEFLFLPLFYTDTARQQPGLTPSMLSAVRVRVRIPQCVQLIVTYY